MGSWIGVELIGSESLDGARECDWETSGLLRLEARLRLTASSIAVGLLGNGVGVAILDRAEYDDVVEDISGPGVESSVTSLDLGLLGPAAGVANARRVLAR
jgi:hypothetical protein